MSAQLLKISDAHLAAVGAKSQDEFIAKVVELASGAKSSADAATKAIEGIGSNIASAVAEGMKGVNASIGELTTTVAGHTKSLGNPEILTEAKIREIATTAGSSEAAKALGATGLTPAAPPSAAAKAAGDANAAANDLLKAGKYAEAFAANRNWQAEFGDVKVFTAFMKAQRGGHVKLRE